jgi:hypothetical protein
MEEIITESKLDGAILSWMDKKYGPDKLEVIIHPNYPNSIFYKKDEKVIMEQDKKNKYFWFDYDEIWSVFQKFFGLKYEETQRILRIWLEKTLKLEGFTPPIPPSGDVTVLEKTFKLEGFTPL